MFHYTSCGLPNVWLKNGYEIHETAYGEGVSIEDVEGLHRAIGMDIVENRPEMGSEAVRFIRKELDMHQSQLAQLLGVSTSSLRGWENGRAKISAPADRVLRILYVEHVNGDGYVSDLIDRISQLNRKAYHEEQLSLEATKDGWRMAA